MTKINMLTDSNLIPIPVAKPHGGGDLETILTADTATDAIDVSGYDVIQLEADVEIKVKIGIGDDDTFDVTSTDYDFRLPGDRPKDISVKNANFIKIFPSDAGTAYIHGWK